MESSHRSGIYAIEHVETGRFYIGSSADIPQRWYQHRQALNGGKHQSPHLQRAWTKYGPDAFAFYILEDCDRGVLLEREQEYLDAFLPKFNTCKKAGAGPGWDQWSEASKENYRRVRKEMAAKITHCPKGHPYDETNTYRNAKGSRFCRACATARTNAVYAKETPEQHAWRIFRSADYYERTKADQAEQRKAYMLAHKEEKRAYDQARKDLNRQQSAERRASETPEQRAARLAAKIADYERHKDARLAKHHENYRRKHPEPQPATACKNGHPYTDDSFRMWRGKKLCKICRAATKRAYRERLKVAAV